MGYTVGQIASALGADALGDVDLEVDRLAEPSLAGPNDLALASNPKYAEKLREGAAQAALLWANADWEGMGLKAAIRVGRPRHAMAELTRLYDDIWRSGAGVHDTAFVHPSADISDASVGPLSVIGEHVSIAPGARIGAQVTIAAGTRIGPRAVIRDGARLAHNVTIGADFVAQIGALIGGDGFSFTTPEVSAAETVRETLGAEAGTAQTWSRIHSLGGVEIGDDVEVGAGSSIDRGTIRATKIGTGTKVDSLVQVGHNVEVGEHTLLCGHVGIGGSTTIGSHCILGGKTGVVDNVSVGDRVVTGAGTLIMANVPAGRVMLGYPATQMKASLDSYKALRRLPRDISALKKAVSKLTGSD
ncbi:MAG: UDP-3-O-(3-hydroxymyristoyl)glucosamine N-acyltransferase [Pseudomonadota bacterium]